MKRHGCKFEYEHERDIDLVRAYTIALQALPTNAPRMMAYTMAANMPSRRFWVSECRAAIVVGRMLKGDELIDMKQNKREMFCEIYKRFLSLQEKRPTASTYDLVLEVVNQTAPRFYITPQSAKVMICRALNRRSLVSIIDGRKGKPKRLRNK